MEAKHVGGIRKVQHCTTEENKKRWVNTVIGYFVGGRMAIGPMTVKGNEMWEKYGLTLVREHIYVLFFPIW